MSNDLVLYTHPMSRGRIARWLMEESGQPYTTEILEFGSTIKSPEYLRINPMGKVPALRHGDVVVTEAAAICAYVADAFPEAGLAPEPKERGSYYRWLLFAAGPIEQSCVTKALGFDVPEKQEGLVGYGTHGRMLDTLEGMLSTQEYAAGERFSAADIYLAAQLQWNMMMGVVEERDVFVDYSQRMHQRPACVRADEIDNELAAKLQSS
ncbi:MAG: glutathione S-transferase family protein [Gammaproteobacteria bacterium]|nr:glutathione S-transferase family protein [Gammaproteobacteria bacterium]